MVYFGPDVAQSRPQMGANLIGGQLLPFPNAQKQKAITKNEMKMELEQRRLISVAKEILVSQNQNLVISTSSQLEWERVIINQQTHLKM